MKITLFTIVALCVFALTGCRKETEISGEVFIVTKGAGNYKFGLVQVAVLPLDKTKEEVRNQQGAVEKAWSEALASDKKCDEYESSYSKEERNYRVEELLVDCRDSALNEKEAVYSKYFTTLQLAEVSAQTDSDGKFNLKIPQTGKYAIAAKAERSVSGERREQYFWLFEINTDGTPQKISLSNNNMMTSNYSESLVKASN